ncbi:MAG: hypothetical protein HFE43_05265 [Oscillospiraceae bacterium]|jgi:Cd2+/Zn2+-exporting ATPase|nr:hypothetical protein [Oscillospiraceae bacterium]
MAIKILTLDGLQDSRLCGLLSQLLETIPGVSSAQIDYLSRKLTLDISSKNMTETLDSVTALVKQTFPNVRIRYTDVGNDPAQPPPAGEEPLPEELSWEEEEEPEPEPEKEKKPRQPWKPSPAAARGLLSLICLGGGLLSFIIGLCMDRGSFGADLLMSLSMLFAAASALWVFPDRESLELRVLLLLALLTACVEMIFGQGITAALTLLITQGGLLAVYALRVRFQSELEGCIDILPETVPLIREGMTIPVPREEIQPGSRIAITDGAVFPFTGIIQEGNTLVDRSLRSGSQEPVAVGPGDRVHCGDVNLDSSVTMDVTGLPDRSLAWRLRELLLGNERREQGLPIRWRLVLFLTLGVLTIGAAVFRLWRIPPIDWIHPILLFILNAAPCGVFLTAGIIRQSLLLRSFRRGIYFNGEQSAEDFVQTDTILTGYRGVFTQGAYVFRALEPAEDYSENELLRTAALAELKSDHPIAKVILEKYYEVYGDTPLPEEDINLFEPAVGGVRTMLDRKITFAGSELLMEEIGVDAPKNQTGGVCVYISVQGDYIGRIVLDEPAKPGIEGFIPAVKAVGNYRAMLMSSEDSAAVQTMAEELGFDAAFSGQTAANKKKVQDNLIAQSALNKQGLIYMGEGNDTALFSGECVRVLLGAENMDAFLGIADAMIPSGDPTKLAEAIRMSRRTSRMAVLSVFCGYLLKLVLLGGSFFLSLPLWTAALTGVLPPLTICLLLLLTLRREEHH